MSNHLTRKLRRRTRFDLGKVFLGFQANAGQRRPENAYAYEAWRNEAGNGLVDYIDRSRKEVSSWSASAADR